MSPKQPGARQQTAELLERLQRHYIKPGPMPGGAFIPECGVNGGAQRRADALYVGFTSTSGRILVGHELKVSRADWRKELDSAGKADFWADNCHAWYIVAPGPDVVPKEELPHGWGLMYPSTRTKTRMDVVVRPAVHADRVPSWTAVRSIMARLDTLRAQHDHQVERNAREKATAEARQQIERERGRNGGLTSEQRRRLELLDELEERLGAKIEGWWSNRGESLTPQNAAAALRLVTAVDALGIDGPAYELASLKRTADQMLAGLVEYDAARAALLELMGGDR